MEGVCVCTVPDTPHIDVAKCSRSTSSVVLVLEAPSQDTDVVDGYRVFYSTDQDRPLDAWVCCLLTLSSFLFYWYLVQSLHAVHSLHGEE